MFVATYQDIKKGEELARKAGWDGVEGFLYFVHDDMRMDVSKRFDKLDDAVRWLQEIVAKKSVFGCGDIIELEAVPIERRCDYCTCRGMRPVREILVTTDEIEREEPRDDCAYEED